MNTTIELLDRTNVSVVGTYMRRDDLRIYVDWFRTIPWQCFGTFTFAWAVSDPQAAQVFKELINRLERVVRCPIGYLRGDEKRFSGWGMPASPRHFHVLLAAAATLDPTWVGAMWMKMAGFGDKSDGAVVVAFDPTRNGSAIEYTLKLIFEPEGDWSFNNLDLFLRRPQGMNINHRQRRRMSRHAYRMLHTTHIASSEKVHSSGLFTSEGTEKVPRVQMRSSDLRTPDRGDDPSRESGSAKTTRPQISRVSTDENVSDCEPFSYGKKFSTACPLSGNLQLKRRVQMMTKKRSNGVALRTTKDLAEEALQLDRKIRAKAKTLHRDFTELGALLAGMRDLWRYLPGNKYKSLEEYATAALGESMSRSRVYELVTAYGLTAGPHAIPAGTVARMGIKKASELARVEPSERTPELVRTAVEQSLPVVRRAVQAKLNETLPSDEQKPMLKLLAINLPEEYVDEFEELMEVMVYMEGIRDGDKTQTMRHKAFHAMLQATYEYWAPELAEALKLKRAKEGLNPAATAAQDCPDEDGDLDFSDDEQAQLQLGGTSG
jgi:hypothetical protein